MLHARQALTSGNHSSATGPTQDDASDVTLTLWIFSSYLQLASFPGCLLQANLQVVPINSYYMMSHPAKASSGNPQGDKVLMTLRVSAQL